MGSNCNFSISIFNLLKSLFSTITFHIPINKVAVVFTSFEPRLSDSVELYAELARSLSNALLFRVQNMVSSSMRAKLAAYSLALLLHVGHMTADLTLLHQDLGITEAR